jgi:hypothetical protein
MELFVQIAERPANETDDQDTHNSCSGIRSVVIPAGVALLGSGCFSDCKHLRSVDFWAGSVLREIESKMTSEMSSNIPFSGLKDEMNYSRFQFVAGRSTHNSRRLDRRSTSFDVSVHSKNILGVPIQCDIPLYSIVHLILCDLVSARSRQKPSIMSSHVESKRTVARVTKMDSVNAPVTVIAVSKVTVFRGIEKISTGCDLRVC